MMDNENKKLTPMKFLPDVQQMPWGTVEYKLADLGFVDSMACEGWLKGNTLSDIMQTYLERIVGETSFDWYGTQFPVLVKRLEVKGRTSLHITTDDETAEQRYDAFGKTALWYVEKAGPDARLFLGFKKDVTAQQFFQACQNDAVTPLLHSVVPQAGECYLITPGLVHAAKDVTLLEIAEASELWFRLYDWGKTERELHLEEAFDLIDFKKWTAGAIQSGNGGKKEHAARIAATPQFTVNRIQLAQPLKSHREEDDTFLLYICTRGEAVIQADGKNYSLKQGDVLLIPAECGDFFLIPAGDETELLEVHMDPRQETEMVSEPVEE